MSTGSFIEMFMTTFGWHLYEIVWGVISSTGLTYLPFFAVIIDNVVKPIESQEAKAAAATSLRRVEIDIIRLIIMMMLAVSPYMTIQYGAISYTKACQTESGTPGGTVTAGNSGTRFDEIFKPNLLNNQEAKAPPWFYIVMSVSGGINDAVITRLPCEINMRQAEYELSTILISDPHLKRQTQRFVTECFKPAVADFYNNHRELPDNIDVSDIAWPGSQYFNNNFYQTEFAKHPVSGFEFDTNRQSDNAHATANENNVTPQNGYPSCHEWWNDSSSGIREGLSEEFPSSIWDRFSTMAFASSDELENAAIREMLRNEGKSIYDGLNVGGSSTIDIDLGDILSMSALDLAGDVFGGTAGTAGAKVAEVLIQPAVFMVKQMAPYVQATMLMATYFLLPWVLLVGNYSWSTIKTATITIFAIKFWTTIWAVTDFLDSNLQQVILGARDSNFIREMLSHQNWMLDSIIDLLVLSLYMALPFFFLSILGWGGERGASAASSASTAAGNEGKAAGNQGTEMAKNAVTK